MMMDSPLDDNYRCPAFQITNNGKTCAVFIFPRLYSPEIGYVIPPVVQERIDAVCITTGISEDDVLLVALNRTLTSGVWATIFGVADKQGKSIIAVATDCAERSERAVAMLRMDMAGNCEPLT